MPSREESIAAIRRFNRHYTPVMRLLGRSYIDSQMSTMQSAVLIEIGEQGKATARDLARLFGVDKGYLSRIIAGFEAQGLIERISSAGDARVYLLSLTPAGKARVAELVASGERIVAEAFGQANDAQLEAVAAALSRVLGILEGNESR